MTKEILYVSVTFYCQNPGPGTFLVSPQSLQYPSLYTSWWSEVSAPAPTDADFKQSTVKNENTAAYFPQLHHQLWTFLIFHNETYRKNLRRIYKDYETEFR